MRETATEEVRVHRQAALKLADDPCCDLFDVVEQLNSAILCLATRIDELDTMLSLNQRRARLIKDRRSR